MPTSTTSGGEVPTTTSDAVQCTTAVPDDRGHVPADACNANYAFDPSFAANCAFAVIFGLTFAAHFIQAIAWKKLVAFIVKTLGSENQQDMGYAIAGQLFFLLAPLWINAFVYMTVARILHYAVADQRAWRIKAVWLTHIFIWIDVICFLIQAAGGMLMSNTDVEGDDPLLRTGQQVYMAGCGAQLAFVIVFSGMMVRIYHKIVKAPKLEANISRSKMLMVTTLAVLVLVVMRIIFRLVEFGPGANEDNPILTNENYALGLDAFPMALASILLNAVHPGWVLRGPDSEFPRKTRAEKRRIKQEKKDAKAARKHAKKNQKDSFAMLEQGNSSDMLEQTSPYEPIRTAPEPSPMYGHRLSDSSQEGYGRV